MGRKEARAPIVLTQPVQTIESRRDNWLRPTELRSRAFQPTLRPQAKVASSQTRFLSAALFVSWFPQLPFSGSVLNQFFLDHLARPKAGCAVGRLANPLRKRRIIQHGAKDIVIRSREITTRESTVRWMPVCCQAARLLSEWFHRRMQARASCVCL